MKKTTCTFKHSDFCHWLEGNKIYWSPDLFNTLTPFKLSQMRSVCKGWYNQSFVKVRFCRSKTQGSSFPWRQILNTLRIIYDNIGITCAHLLQNCMSIERASVPILKINSINCAGDRRYCTSTTTVHIPTHCFYSLWKKLAFQWWCIIIS